MKLRKKLLLFLLIYIFTLIQIYPSMTFAAKKDSDEYSGTIEVIMNVDTVLMNKYINDFSKKYPGVTVKYTCYSDYETDIMKRIDSGDYGDVLFIPASIDSTGVLKYLEPLGKVSDYDDKYNFIENAYILENKLYSIPSTAYLKGIIYNKEVFDKAGVTRTPKSTEEFLDALKMIKERTNSIPFYTNSSMDWILNDWSFFPYIEQTGDANYRGEYFVYEENPFLKGTNYYKSYKLLYDIVKNNLCEDQYTSYEFDELCQKVNSGEIASIMLGTWAYDSIKYAGSNTDSLAYMPFPNEIDGKQYATLGIDYGYSVSKNSKNKAAAKKFIEFMIEESGYAIDNNRISIVKSDPLPDIYSNIKNLEVKINKPFSSSSYNYYSILSSTGNPESSDYIHQVIDEARNPAGDFDRLMERWNTTWENGRPSYMVTHSYDYIKGQLASSSTNNDSSTQSFIMDNRNVEYSSTELSYINDKKTLTVGYLTNLAPFQYDEIDVDGNESFNGLSKVICDSIRDSTQMDFKYIGYDNYQDMTDALASGKIDIAAGIRANDSNAEKLKFSKSYFKLSNVIIKKDTLKLDELSNESEGYIIGNEINSGISTTAKRKGYDSVKDVFEAIDQNSVSFAVCNYYSAHYYMNAGSYSYLSLVPLTEQTDYCLAFAEDVDTRLVSICNKCIYSFPEDRLQMLVAQYMDPKAEPITFKRYIKDNPLQVALFVILMILFIGGIFYELKKEKYLNQKKHAIDIKRYTILSQLTDEYVFEYDFKSNTIHFDSKFNEKFGFDQDIVFNKADSDNRALQEFKSQLNDKIETSAINSEPFKMSDIQSKSQWYRMTSYCINDEKQQPQHIIGKIVNIQGFVEEKEEMEKLADLDSLTSLYNRAGFTRKFASLSEKYSASSNFIMAVIDLDDFKSVNDSLGHLGGDEALKTLAQELSNIVTENIICGRYGGDEFIVSMFDVTKQQADITFSRLVHHMNQELNFDGKIHLLSISLGAIHIDKITSFHHMFECADSALYKVKQKGKNQYLLEEAD